MKLREEMPDSNGTRMWYVSVWIWMTYTLYSKTGNGHVKSQISAAYQHTNEGEPSWSWQLHWKDLFVCMDAFDIKNKRRKSLFVAAQPPTLKYFDIPGVEPIISISLFFVISSVGWHKCITPRYCIWPHNHHNHRAHLCHPTLLSSESVWWEMCTFI